MVVVVSEAIGFKREREPREISKQKKREREEKVLKWVIDTAASCETRARLHRSYNQGLISADRSNKATLLLTIPRCLLSRLQRISRAQCLELLFSDQACAVSAGPVAQLYGTGRSYRYSRHRATVLVSGTDSDLEAFSHNPTDGSFSPLASQLSENTNYLNQRFLSY